MSFSLFKRKPSTAEAERAYDAIVGQARTPFFYLEGGVPDTVDGRFDLIVLDAFLVIDRTNGQGKRAETFGQALFDTLFSDMDANLRAMGVSDLRIGKKVKEMAQAFYGRSVAYRDALASSDAEELADALRRNLYRQTDVDDNAVAVMTGYVRTQAGFLNDQPLELILAGNPQFERPNAEAER
jgi:cytochrome b pre-mRNA-processing protein 3